MKCNLLNRPLLMLLLAACAALLPQTGTAAVVGFEDLAGNLTGPEPYWIGADVDRSQGDPLFISGNLSFSNHYHMDVINNVEVPYWDGFAYSNSTDPTVPTDHGWEAYKYWYTAAPGAGADTSDTYGIGFMGFLGIVPTIEIPDGKMITSAEITNTTYAYYSMFSGDGFAKKFGGLSGNDEDYFLLTLTGKDTAGDPLGTVPFYLADFRDADSLNDYVLNTWEEVDLSSLAGAKTIEFALTSTDNHPDWGMNTPAYFAIDNLTVADLPGGGGSGVPEPSTFVLALLAMVAWIGWRRRRAS